MNDTSNRLHEIKGLPDFMQDNALVSWATTATILGTCVPKAREIIRDSGIPLVAISERKRLPRWGALREFLFTREQRTAAADAGGLTHDRR